MVSIICRYLGKRSSIHADSLGSQIRWFSERKVYYAKSVFGEAEEFTAMQLAQPTAALGSQVDANRRKPN